MAGPGPKPLHPRDPRKWSLCMPACPCSQSLPQDLRLWGQIRACSKAQASKSRDFTCGKLKIKRF